MFWVLVLILLYVCLFVVFCFLSVVFTHFVIVFWCCLFFVYFLLLLSFSGSSVIDYVFFISLRIFRWNHGRPKGHRDSILQDGPSDGHEPRRPLDNGSFPEALAFTILLRRQLHSSFERSAPTDGRILKKKGCCSVRTVRTSGRIPEKADHKSFPSLSPSPRLPDGREGGLLFAACWLSLSD